MTRRVVGRADIWAGMSVTGRGHSAGCCIDNLPDNPYLLVCNTDPSYKPGRPWIAIYIEDGRGEFFDSFGHRPNIDFERYMDRHYVSWTFNDGQLQSYCVYVCVRRSRGIDMRKIARSFTNDTGLNDVLVHAYVCSRQ